MSDPFFGEVRVFCFQFAPVGWAFCAGQQISIQQNPALYAVIGNIYGGDLKTYFNVPNLQTLAVMGTGPGPGLTNRIIGKTFGESSVTLNNSTMPNHNHELQAQGGFGNSVLPVTGAYLCGDAGGGGGRSVNISAPASAVTPGNTVTMAPNALGAAGASAAVAAHENCQPWLGMNFCIATDGEFPMRN